jgi:glyoxylase-like metal-dependent hydrolase (beta-lactamase superfamily II)
MEFHIIPTGRVWIDPGGAFGLVPKVLWEKYQSPNQCHLLAMDLNSLLVLSEGKTILVDTGIGHKLPEKAAHNWGLEWPEGTLLENLEKHDLSADDIDIVINTHLHSDHCGGNTFLENSEVLPTFPKAEYWIQRIEFTEAMHPDARTRGTYLPENYVPLWERGQVKLLHGDTQITGEVKCQITRGHTRTHQSVILDDGTNPPVIFLADLVAYAVQIGKAAWGSAYDIEPLETIQTKQNLQKWGLEHNVLMIFEHDPIIRAGRLVKDEQGNLKVETEIKGSLG